MTPQRPPPPPIFPAASWGWLVMFSGFLAVVLWSAWAPLDKGISVQGTVIAEGYRQPVQHTQGGTVGSVKVKEGDKVKAGQVLIQLDTRLAQTEWNAMQEAIAGLQAQLTGLTRSQGHKSQQLVLLNQQLQSITQLAQEGLVARNRVLELERQKAQLQDQQEQDRTQTQQLLRQVAELREKSQGLQITLAQKAITAPTDGQVQSMSVFGPGGVVAPGQVVLDIVPVAARLVVEAQVPVHLADRVRLGLPVELMLTTLNQHETPILKGEVLHLSSDRLVDERTGIPYYKMQTTLTPPLAAPKTWQLRHGMPVEVFVQTGERTLLSYLLKPLRDRLHNGMRED